MTYSYAESLKIDSYFKINHSYPTRMIQKDGYDYLAYPSKNEVERKNRLRKWDQRKLHYNIFAYISIICFLHIFKLYRIIKQLKLDDAVENNNIIISVSLFQTYTFSIDLSLQFYLEYSLYTRK